jgi:general secretion pathway protein E
VPNSELIDFQPHAVFLQTFPIRFARDHLLIAFEPAGDGGCVPLAFGGEASTPYIEDVRRLLGRPLKPFAAAPNDIRKAIDAAYQSRGSQTSQAIATLDENQDVLRIPKAERQDLLDQQGSPPVIRLVNSILYDAVQNRASDIHIQPCDDRLQVRFRIDGILFDQFEIPKTSQEEILSRVKIIGKMNIAEKRLPQDGRATAEIGDRTIDLRIASLPTSHGERIVIRLLDKSAQLYSLDELGMGAQELEQFQRLIHLEHGLILVTGPTGGGKSTTLYASLQEINTKSANVVTLEDPIEYQLEGVSQTQISDKKGMTFASGLRSILRQDPDIIMIGEIRDQATAELAIQSALTGHMVFSTLHTNDAPTAVTRLLDLGIEPFLVASSVLGVLSQRLVRRICNECRIEDDTGKPDTLGYVGKAFRGAGCPVCRETGYRGRLGIFELMVIDSRLQELIQSRANAAELRTTARENGMKPLSTDGLAKVRDGRTTLAEVARISVQNDQGED